MIVSQLVALLVIFITLDLTASKLWEIPLPGKLQECYNLVKTENVDSYVGSQYSWHCEHMLNESTTQDYMPYDNHVTDYITKLYEKSIRGARKRRQSTLPPCVRKEYRMLTLDERTRFHNAVNALKRDTSVSPNRYDSFASFHTGVNNLIAHNGPGFLGWHRIFLLMFETALRQVDPTVCLPYWDSTLDNQLADPFTSSVWTAEYFGTPRGAVTAGPFANWRMMNGSPLMRNAGVDGELFSLADITNILSRNRHEDIVSTTRVNAPYNLEIQHGSVHVYVSGAMALLETSAYDPIFFMHHTFIDYVWERFRARLRGQLNVNPATYPQVNVNPRHVATAPTGFPNYTQADGYSETLARRATYEPVPTCSATNTSCGGRFLVCQTRTGRCLPSTRSLRARRSLPTLGPAETCERLTYGAPYQNDYCCEQSCDTSKWAMVPVKIVSVRPPKYQSYDSYTVSAGNLNKDNDIYSPKAYAETNKYITSRQGNPKTYEVCEKDSSTGQVFFYSKGINYAGYYKESTIVDHRQAVSIALGFVGVKKPAAGEVLKALIRAHDSCGRVCRVACKDPVTQEYKDCSGAVAISDETPLMYGSNYDEALMKVFDFATNDQCPRFKPDDFYITFFSNYVDGNAARNRDSWDFHALTSRSEDDMTCHDKH